MDTTKVHSFSFRRNEQFAWKEDDDVASVKNLARTPFFDRWGIGVAVDMCPTCACVRNLWCGQIMDPQRWQRQIFGHSFQVRHFVIKFGAMCIRLCTTCTSLSMYVKTPALIWRLTNL